MLSRLVSALLIALLASPAAALSFSNLYVFGDSIVDQGNTQALVTGGGGADPAPSSLGYFDGRFTNGINPADVLNFAIEGTNSVGSLSGGDNYAYGGARARTDGDGIPDLAFQVGEFLTDVGGVADSNALYTINVGGNDIRDILLNNLDATAVTQAAAAELALQVSALSAAGAQHILVVGVPDVGAVPEVQALGAGAVFVARLFSEQINTEYQNALPGSVTYYDTIGFQDALTLDPTAFGLPAGLDLSTACLLAGAPDPSGAPTCNDYAFFDTVHPTSQVLQLLGDELVLAVPEPGTGLLIGMGMGVMAWRRRRA